MRVRWAVVVLPGMTWVEALTSAGEDVSVAGAAALALGHGADDAR